MSNLIVVFGTVVLGKLLINFSRYTSCKKYFESYKTVVGKPTWDIWEIQPKIVKLLKDAGVEDSFITVIRPVSFNKNEVTKNISVLKNIGNNRADVVNTAYAMFHQAIGTYKSRMVDAINPIYWLELAVFLPKNIFQYVGASPESTLIKSTQIIYWLIVSSVSVFGDEINAYIKDILLSVLNTN